MIAAGIAVFIALTLSATGWVKLFNLVDSRRALVVQGVISDRYASNIIIATGIVETFAAVSIALAPDSQAIRWGVHFLFLGFSVYSILVRSRGISSWHCPCSGGRTDTSKSAKIVGSLALSGISLYWAIGAGDGASATPVLVLSAAVTPLLLGIAGRARQQRTLWRLGNSPTSPRHEDAVRSG